MGSTFRLYSKQSGNQGGGVWNTGNTYLVREVPGGRAPRVDRYDGADDPGAVTSGAP